MPRFDKVEPKGGSFRAPLNFAVASGDVGVVVGVGLDTSGRVVKGASNTGVVAVICPSRVMAAGEPIDCMTDGEIVDTALTAGTVYYAAAADGAVSTTNTGTQIGFTCQTWRLIVRVAQVVGA
jgi:hypothetical protein